MIGIIPEMSHVVLKIHAAWHVSDRISLRPRWAAVLGSFNSSTLSGRQPHTPKPPRKADRATQLGLGDRSCRRRCRSRSPGPRPPPCEHELINVFPCARAADLDLSSHPIDPKPHSFPAPVGKDSQLRCEGQITDRRPVTMFAFPVQQRLALQGLLSYLVQL